MKAQHGATNFANVGQFTTAPNAEVDVPVPTGTLKNLDVKTSAVTGGGTIVITAFKNGAATALTCTVAVTATTCSDTSDSVAYSAGDTMSFRVVNNSGTGGQDPILTLSATFG